MFPTTTDPVCSPMPMWMGTLPCAARSSFHSATRFCIFTAARTALVASSGRANGAPQRPMIASPMNLSRMPLCSKRMSTISSK